MEDYTEILQEALDGFELSLKLQLLKDKRKASGATIDSIHSEVGPTSGKLLGSSVLYFLIYGRGPTGVAEKGEPTLFELIKKWVKTKGIPDAAAWPITQNIHKKGTLLFQGLDPRFPGLRVATTLDEVINKVTLGDLRAKLGTAARQNVASELVNLNP